ncbi:OHS family lactose permease-like MFS transporter [Novosphingobium sp. SG751A]|uniref:oligosaccharide MFS transporter n=1 Tax=Novosphingobium sp. SG751A TaxID=2587000 RepID=UPI001557BD9D|nr:oligosaccharide MFS transporter [Novosphingobium sp. SG751A]NOW48438.1 OHS family lactose permease-like MFS transporter [Novosphingobium sp. SG751A]
MLQGQARRNYLLVSGYVAAFFFAQAAAISLLSIWLSQRLGLSGAQVGTVFSANFIAAMVCQPLYGWLSDRMGYRRTVPLSIAIMVVLAGPFFSFVYAPLLRDHLLFGAILGGAYIGATFVAGSYAIESFVDRVSRRDGFEYSRARLWGSLGFSLAALFSGRLFNLDPRINFFLASAAGLVLIPLILALRGNVIAPIHVDAPRPVTLADSLGVLRLAKFWRFMVLILGVTNLYLVYDQQFPAYFASLFPTREAGNAMFGYLNSAQIFVEAGMMFIAPIIVNRIGMKRGLLLATTIMITRIAATGVAAGPWSISACKMLHSLELPILLVSIFRYIAAHFETRLSGTLYMVGVSFGHSLGLAILSPVAGRLYDAIGFRSTYFTIAAFALCFWIASLFALAPDPEPRLQGKD